MRRDYSRVASLFTIDGVMQTSPAAADVLGQNEIRSGLEQRHAVWRYFIQTTRSGAIELEGDTAVGRAYLQELMRARDGSSQHHYGVYRDRYRRTRDGWKFTERLYEVRPRDLTSLLETARS
jgi:ketosteroid isomerase-like protein